MNTSGCASRAVAALHPAQWGIVQAKENCLPVPSVGRENGGGPT